MSRRSLGIWVLLSLLTVHTVLGVYYSLTIPIWESYDEIGHYYFVHYLATEHRLPPPDLKLVAHSDESRQPPLYYILAAIPVSFIDAEDGMVPQANPHAGRPMGEGGRNWVIHDTAAESWPYHGTVLAVHVARLTSVAAGALALLFTFLLARQLFTAQPLVYWGAPWIVALWPQFRFMSAVINNDIMATAAGAAIAWLLARIFVGRQPTIAGTAWLGLAVGAALLSKNSVLPLLPPVAVVVLVLVWRSVPAVRWRFTLGLLGAAMVSTALVGWWYLRNLGGSTGMFGGYDLTVVPMIVRNTLLSNHDLRLVLPSLLDCLQSFWARYGWGNIDLPSPHYWLAATWCGLAGVGLLLWSLRRPPREQARRVALLAVLTGGLVGEWLLFMAGTGWRFLPGRYLLPVLPMLAVLLSLGWHALLPRVIRPAGMAGMIAALGLLVALAPHYYIEPVYAMPQQVTAEEAQSYTPIHVTFGDSAELVGYRLQDTFVDPGGAVHLTLWWRVLGRTEVDYSLAAQVFAGERRLLGEVHRFPGQGSLTTTTWRPGMVFSEDMTIGLSGEAAGPSVAWIELSFFNHADPGQALAVTGPSDGRLGNSVRLARVKIRGDNRDGLPTSQRSVAFGPAIRLLDCGVRFSATESPQTLHLDLLWGAAERPEQDYTVSLQLRDGAQAIVRQADGEPQEGAQPTSLWEPGETVSDPYSLQIPAGLAEGTYTLYLSVYYLPTLERLLATDETGRALANREVALLRFSSELEAAPEVIPVCPLVHVAEPQAGG